MPEAGGDATASGVILGLTPDNTDAKDITVGLGTLSAGAQTGTVTLAALSDAGSGTTSPLPQIPLINVFGNVYRVGAAAIAPVNLFVHAGDPGRLR